MVRMVSTRSASLRRLSADPAHGPLPALMLVLTVLTGVVDAVSILSLGRVFVANMTGNVVFIGFALAGASGFSLSASLSALGGFLVGAGLGGVAVVRRMLAVGAMLAGAVLGALLVLDVSNVAALGFAAALLAVVVVWAGAGSRSPARWHAPRS